MPWPEVNNAYDGGTDGLTTYWKYQKSSLQNACCDTTVNFLDVETLDLAGGDMGLNIVNNIIKDVG